MQIILLVLWEVLVALTAVPPGLLAGVVQLSPPEVPAHLITGLGAAVAAVAAEGRDVLPALAVVVAVVVALLTGALLAETPDFRDARPVQLRTTV
jgi:hypothetical protein